jgi:NAD(P)-dependent dehydrogenase (short-subunit alcohol dehydrogenase family)
VDVTATNAVDFAMGSLGLQGSPFDIVINNAGYFYEPYENVTDNAMNFDEQLNQIDICALGPLRVTNAMFQMVFCLFGTTPSQIFFNQYPQMI